MTGWLRRILACWALLLAAVLCLGFLPVSRLTAVFLILWIAAGAVVLQWLLRRGKPQSEALHFEDLPDATYRQPVVLCTGCEPPDGQDDLTVLTAPQGCWIRIDSHRDIRDVGLQLLAQRPEWGRQLSVRVTVCPQQHTDADILASRLRAVRWQIAQLRRATRQAVPLILQGQVGSSLISVPFFEAALPGEPVTVWQADQPPQSVGAWVGSSGDKARQQILMNSLTEWFHHHVLPVFNDEDPDVPQTVPGAVIWGMSTTLTNVVPGSLWQNWLARKTRLRQVAGWQPAAEGSADTMPEPDFVLPLLPEGNGFTPRQRARRLAFSLFTLAAIAALLCSGWNNHRLIQRLTFDIGHYYRLPMDAYAPKADAVDVLKQDALQLDRWARHGAPLKLGLGLYHGGSLHLPVLDAIRSYVPPPPPPPPKEPEPAPKIVRLDSMSLFDSGKSELKTGSTKMLVNSLVGIKARPGWLIVVAGHTDNTGNPKLNQILSRKRAESVRDWMRDTGDVPDSCFAVQGVGESRPEAPNDTPQGRALNRRVEISLVPQADACQRPDITPTSSQDDGGYNNEMEK